MDSTTVHVKLAPVPELPNHIKNQIKETEIQKYLKTYPEEKINIDMNISEIEEKYPELAKNIQTSIKPYKIDLEQKLTSYYNRIGFVDEYDEIPGYLVGNITNIVDKLRFIFVFLHTI